MASRLTLTITALPSNEARARDRYHLHIWHLNGMLLIATRRFSQEFFAPGDAQAYNQDFINVLEDLRWQVQKNGLEVSESDCERYLTRLRDAGAAAYNQFFSQAAREELTYWESKQRERGLTLTLTVPTTTSLFWEMLYTGDPNGLDPTGFWGYRLPIGRMYWDIKPQDHIRLQSGVFSAIHDKLLSSRREIEFLEQQLAQVCASVGAQVTVLDLDQALTAEVASVEDLMKLITSEEFRFGLIHFACHCSNPQDAGAAQASLRITLHGTEIDVRLQHFQRLQSMYRFHHEPFVFLNACESATPDHLMEMLSFPLGMLGFGAGGVLATACAIPDNFASAFASAFYGRLLDTSTISDKSSAVNFGEALQATRKYFLDKYNNPLGLAYGLYSMPYQELWLAG